MPGRVGRRPGQGSMSERTISESLTPRATRDAKLGKAVTVM